MNRCPDCGCDLSDFHGYQPCGAVHIEEMTYEEIEALRTQNVRLREAIERALSLADGYKEALERTLCGEITDVANAGAARRKIAELTSP